MPSTLLASVSGGALLVSGNPYSGGPLGFIPHMIRIRLDSAASGNIYVGMLTGYSSGALGLGSGGALGGLTDGMQFSPGYQQDYALPPQGIAGVAVYVPPTCSGNARVFWQVY